MEWLIVNMEDKDYPMYETFNAARMAAERLANVAGDRILLFEYVGWVEPGELIGRKPAKYSPKSK